MQYIEHLQRVLSIDSAPLTNSSSMEPDTMRITSPSNPGTYSTSHAYRDGSSARVDNARHEQTSPAHSNSYFSDFSSYQSSPPMQHSPQLSPSPFSSLATDVYMATPSTTVNTTFSPVYPAPSCNYGRHYSNAVL